MVATRFVIGVVSNMTNNPNTSVDEDAWLDSLEVEFLHGVPVKLPVEAKTAIKAHIQEAVVAAQDVILEKAYWAVKDVNLRLKGQYDAQQAIEAMRQDLPNTLSKKGNK